LKHLNIFYAAAGNIARHSLKSIVVVLCLSAILVPFISALSISEGIKKQSMMSIEQGADIYLTMDMYGRNGMVPGAMGGEIEKMDGVLKAVPRVIGRIYVEGRLAVLLGLPEERLASTVRIINGTPPGRDGIIIGKGLADSLGLKEGSSLSIGVRIFTVLDHVPYIQKKVYRVSGIFDAESSIWTSNLIMLDIDEAIAMFEMEGFVTDIAVYVAPGHTRQVAESLQKMNSFFRVQDRGTAKTYMERGFNTKSGIFASLYTVAFAVGIPLIIMLTGFGLSERKKEVGILKATGWHTHEVLEMVFYENLVLSLIAASASYILSFLWVRLFNGAFISRIFITGIDGMSSFPVPAEFSGMQLFLSLFLSLVLTMSGSIYAAWRTAVIPPAEAVR